MRIGIIQSNYIPWRGYFDFIDDVDLFIFHDDLQNTKRDWRNRNLIKTQAGPKWLTVPVKYQRTSQLICETEIDYSKDWQSQHINKIRGNYAKAPFVRDVLEIMSEGFSTREKNISQLNIRLLKCICLYLNIKTPLARSMDYDMRGTKTERLIHLLKQVGASIYLAGPTSEGYLEKALFIENGIKLEYKTYSYEPYPQPYGDFDGAVSIVDLIANCGQGSRKVLKSTRPNEVIIL